MLLLFAFFKAGSLDGHMAFLLTVHYVIFLLVLILYASLENKFFFFFFYLQLITDRMCKTQPASTAIEALRA